jgi:glycosyltransferase involved in cell wall biosynthesis
VGGTNPSLLRAIGASAPTIAFDVTFNREVVGKAGLYFRDAADVARLVDHAESHPDDMRARSEAARKAAERYDWDDVAASYERLCVQLKHRELVRPPGKGTRRGTTGATSGRVTSS